MENITLSKELITNIKELSIALTEKEVDDFSNLLKERSEKLKIEYNQLLELVISREKLHDLILEHTLKFDKEIEKLENQVNDLKAQKYQMGSLLCELFGHEYGEREYCDATYCKNCGKRTLLRGPEATKYYRKLDRRNTPIYKKPESSR